MAQTPTDPPGDAKPTRRSKAQKVPVEIRIKVSWCKGCGLCVDYCKTDVLAMEGVLPKVVRADRCNRCLQCEAICPDFAIEVCDAVAAVQAGEGGGAALVRAGDEMPAAAAGGASGGRLT